MIYFIFLGIVLMSMVTLFDLLRGENITKNIIILIFLIYRFFTYDSRSEDN